MPDNHAWLDMAREAPLDPDRPLIDPHHHLWEFDSGTYLARDLRTDMLGHNVRETVFVECGTSYDASASEPLQPVGETHFVCEAASAGTSSGNDARIASGISAFANLQQAEAISDVLRAHTQAADGRLRGIRHSCTWHRDDAIRNSHSNPPPSLFLRDDFRAGFAHLDAQGLLFEAWCYHTQLDELAQLASAFPDTTIVLNHVGGPLGIGRYAGRRAEVLEAWKAGIDRVAACDNVVVKLGGLGMPMCGFSWHRQPEPPSSGTLASAWQPYFSYCIEGFGFERCMFESNFPVDKVSCSYVTLWNAFKRIAATLPQSAQDALLHDNAARIYSL